MTLTLEQKDRLLGFLERQDLETIREHPTDLLENIGIDYLHYCPEVLIPVITTLFPQDGTPSYVFHGGVATYCNTGEGTPRDIDMIGIDPNIYETLKPYVNIFDVKPYVNLTTYHNSLILPPVEVFISSFTHRVQSEWTTPELVTVTPAWQIITKFLPWQRWRDIRDKNLFDIQNLLRYVNPDELQKALQLVSIQERFSNEIAEQLNEMAGCSFVPIDRLKQLRGLICLAIQ